MRKWRHILERTMRDRFRQPRSELWLVVVGLCTDGRHDNISETWMWNWYWNRTTWNHTYRTTSPTPLQKNLWTQTMMVAWCLDIRDKDTPRSCHDHRPQKPTNPKARYSPFLARKRRAIHLSSLLESWGAMNAPKIQKLHKTEHLKKGTYDTLISG